MFIRFDITHERDRRTDTAWRHRPRLRIASRGKNVTNKMCIKTVINVQLKNCVINTIKEINRLTAQ